MTATSWPAPASDVLSRRRLLALAAAVASTGLARPACAEATRVATVDWALLETLLAIGVVPVAAAELMLYRRIAVEPAVPSSVADIGLRGTPNFEALRLARPDLIFSSNFYTWAEAKLALVAPVETVSIYGLDDRPYVAAENAALRLGEATGRTAAARRLVDDARADLGRLEARLAGGDGRPIVVINFGDARHFRVFGTDSMFGEVLSRLGLANAWSAGTRYSASAPIGLEALAGIGDAWIIVIPPVPPDATRTLAGGAFWKALLPVAAGRVRVLESIDPFGGLPAATRFARLLAAALPFGEAAGG